MIITMITVITVASSSKVAIGVAGTTGWVADNSRLLLFRLQILPHSQPLSSQTTTETGTTTTTMTMSVAWPAETRGGATGDSSRGGAIRTAMTGTRNSRVQQ